MLSSLLIVRKLNTTDEHTIKSNTTETTNTMTTNIEPQYTVRDMDTGKVTSLFAPQIPTSPILIRYLFTDSHEYNTMMTNNCVHITVKLNKNDFDSIETYEMTCISRGLEKCGFMLNLTKRHYMNWVKNTLDTTNTEHQTVLNEMWNVYLLRIRARIKLQNDLGVDIKLPTAGEIRKSWIKENGYIQATTKTTTHMPIKPFSECIKSGITSELTKVRITTKILAGLFNFTSEERKCIIDEITSNLFFTETTTPGITPDMWLDEVIAFGDEWRRTVISDIWFACTQRASVFKRFRRLFAPTTIIH